ncbi:hypothetical protein FA13DRAFT_1709391 [Coprinellus micaceus]|uniref:Uncharacterized protein n=1 Tax=Coprinellus micaceus TaxID=71717 RepID=A0A4Y7TCM2_COPMI|nr:hypothetical protein FA13DRAFT_1709391 [Coprinellus micaceus]
MHELSASSTPGSDAVFRTALNELERASTEHFLDLEASSATLALLNHSASWQQSNLWNQAIVHSAGFSVDRLKASLAQAASVFKLAEIRSGVDAVTEKCFDYSRLVHVSAAIAPDAADPAYQLWILDLLQKGMPESIPVARRMPSTSDTPAIITLVQAFRSGILTSCIFPRAPTSGMYKFLIGLAHALNNRRQLSPTPDLPSIKDAIWACIAAAIPLWETDFSAHTDYDPRPDRICQIVYICFLSGDLSRCAGLFASLSSTDTVNVEQIVQHVKVIHLPLIKALNFLFTEHILDMAPHWPILEPFRSFLARTLLLATHLRDHFKAHSPVSRTTHMATSLPKVGLKEGLAWAKRLVENVSQWIL